MKFKVPMMIPFFNGDEIDYIKNALEKNEISTYGENITLMEQLIKDYLNASYLKLIANGTAGLHLALKAIGIEDGDKVFCPSMTYCGSAYPIIYERGTPVFLDSKEDGTLDEKVLLKALEENKDSLPKAVIVVDTYGSSADYDKIAPILKEYGVKGIEDSAESLGSTFKGQKCGTFLDISVLSFSYSKIVTTSLGGMVLTDNKDYIEKMAYLSNQAKAKSPYYIHKEVGYNYSMSNVLAGIGVSGIKNIDYHLGRKQEIFNLYKEGFKNNKNVDIIGDKEGSNHWQNGIKVENAHKVLTSLIDSSIEARAGFNPMHLQEAFSQYEYICLEQDISKKLFSKTVLLPSGVGMTYEQQQYVIEKVNEFTK